MKVFLIILAVLVLLFAFILSLSAELTVVYDNGWHTSVQVLFIKKDIELSKILNFVLFPDKAGKQAAEKKKEKKKDNSKKSKPVEETKAETTVEPVFEVEAEKTAETVKETETKTVEADASKPKAEPKKNPIAKIIDEDGIVGIMLLASNLVETLNTAVTTLFRGLHIYSLYVKMIVGGADAEEIARSYGRICGFYYPLKGMILNGMKVDQYDDYIQPDFIAPFNEYGFQLIASMNVALILKIGIKAGTKFLVNLIKNK
ncbi:hypothetical protein [uncultured Eubacterium sp.]|uniref:hypothetical protein n=1 Tax=uncultured Eubacterium sp. TaxID=165185 RepID=UPI0028046B3C|nr:hypothetical protein [uncultured Eubacterium sp.]